MALPSSKIVRLEGHRASVYQSFGLKIDRLKLWNKIFSGQLLKKLQNEGIWARYCGRRLASELGRVFLR